MSLTPRRELSILLTVLVLSGAFLFVLKPQDVNAFHATSSYNKAQNDTLSSANWNDLFSDFVNTWLPVSLNGPVGIATEAPAAGLKVNGPINASNIFSTGNIGIGTTDPAARLEVNPLSGYSILAGPSTSTTFKIGNVASPTENTDVATMGWVNSALESVGGGDSLWGGTKNGSIWNGDAGVGNVGIGTTSPGEKLDVNGNISTNGKFILGSQYKISTPSAISFGYGADRGLGLPSSRIALYEYTGNTYFYGLGLKQGAAWGVGIWGGTGGNTPDTANPDMFVQSGGNVGIGTTNPTSKLHIVGGTLGFDNNGIIYASGGSSADISLNTTRSFLVYTGSTVPTFEASVTGGVSIGSYVSSVNMYNVPAGGLIVPGSVGIGTTAPATTLDITGSLRNSLAVTHSALGGVSSAAVVMSDNSGNLFATTTAALLAGVSLPAGTSGQTLRHNGTDWIADSNLFNNSTNVGIGTTAPNEILHVSTNQDTFRSAIFENLSVGTSSQMLLQVRNAADLNSALRFGTLGVNFPTIGSYRQNSGVVAAETNLAGGLSLIARNASGIMTFTTGGYNTERMRITAAGDVGVGTTNPQGKLQVNGSWASTILTGDNVIVKKPDFPAGGGWARTLLSFQEFDGTSYFQIGALGSNNTFTNGYLGAAWDNTTMRWYANKNVVFDGNVGIGTTAPATTLDITGSLRNSLAVTHSALGGVSSAAIVMTDNSGNLFATTTAALLAGVSLPAGTSGQTLRHNGTDWIADSNLFNNSTNVGIGTTAPFRKLSVEGSATIGTLSNGNLNWMPTVGDNQLFLTSVTAAAVNTGSTLSLGGRYRAADNGQIAYASIAGLNETGGEYTNGFMSFYTSRGTESGSNERMRITSTGNVGIGTVAPSTKLDIFTPSISANTNVLTLSTGIYTTTNVEQRLRFWDTRTYELGYIGSGFYTSGGGYVAFGTVDSSTAGLAATEKMRIINNGNVGIGTTDPISKLSLGGQYSDYRNRIALYEHPSGYFRGIGMIHPDSNYGVGIWAKGSTTFPTDANADFVVRDGGNVGIGTTAPATKLDITGSLQNTLAVTHSALGGVSSAAIVMTDNSGNLFATTTASVLGVTGLWNGTKNGNIWNGDAGAGNIGIGTTNPTSKLHIVGGTLGFDNNGIIYASGGSSADISLNTTRSFLVYTGSTVPTFEASVTGGVSIGSYVSSVNMYNVPAGGLIVPGNVGIGTTAPGAPLTVAKIVTAFTDVLMQKWDPLTTNYGLTLSNYNSTGGIDYRFTTLDAGISNPVLTFKQGDVGIGTTNPGANLEVSGAYSGNIFRLTSAGTYSFLQFNEGTASRGYMGFGDNGDIFTGASSDSLSIRAGGDLHLGGTGDNLTMTLKNSLVGIGTIAPVTKLDIIGSLQNTLAVTHSALGGVSSAAIVMTDNSGNLFATTTAALLSGVSLPSGTSGQTLRYDGTSWLANSALFNNGTNVGIGTTNPGKSLQVVGAGMFGDSSDVTNAKRALNLISSAAVMRIYRITSNLGAAAPSVELIGSPNANDSATNFTTWWDFYAGAGDKFNIRRRTGNVAQDKLTIDSNGNVGIGTINPLATLHVNGGVNMKHTSVADADYTILASDYIIGYSSITTNRTVTVPDALCTPGRFFVILDESGSAASGKQIIIDPEGATPIVGQTTFNLFAPYNSVYIFCGNSSWFVL